MEQQPSPNEPTRSRFTKVAAGVGLAAGVALGAGAIAGAVTGGGVAPAGVVLTQTDPSTTVPPSDQAPAPGRPMPRLEKGFGHRGGVGMGIHGEWVVPGRDGGWQTMASQVGEVTAVSSSSIKVKSEDGYERTYAVDDNTVVHAGDEGIGDVAAGDKVFVLAVVTGDTARAVDVRDATAVAKRHDTWAPRKPARPEGGSGQATPSVFRS